MALGFVVMAALGAVALGSARAAWDMYQKFSDASAADAAAQSELAGMQAQYQGVSGTVSDLQTERGLEAAIRARYGVGKPGEGEIDIVRQATTSSQSVGGGQNWLERLLGAVVIW
ncbi:MAG: hypothetical protein AAB919_01670 [Patescibacteria group bacterium]